MPLEFILSPIFAAVAFAVYIHISSGVAGVVNTYHSDADDACEYGSTAFALLMLAGGVFVLTRFLVYEDCKNFLGGWPFGHDTCKPGFRLGATVVNVIKYIPLIFGLAGALYTVRALVAHLTQNVPRRNELLVGFLVCLSITSFSLMLRYSTETAVCIMPCAPF